MVNHTTFNCQTKGETNRMVQNSTILTTVKHNLQACQLATMPLHHPPLNHHSHLADAWQHFRR